MLSDGNLKLSLSMLHTNMRLKTAQRSSLPTWLTTVPSTEVKMLSISTAARFHPEVVRSQLKSSSSPQMDSNITFLEEKIKTGLVALNLPRSKNGLLGLRRVFLKHPNI